MKKEKKKERNYGVFWWGFEWHVWCSVEATFVVFDNIESFAWWSATSQAPIRAINCHIHDPEASSPLWTTSYQPLSKIHWCLQNSHWILDWAAELYASKYHGISTYNSLIRDFFYVLYFYVILCSLSFSSLSFSLMGYFTLYLFIICLYICHWLMSSLFIFIFLAFVT